MAIVKFSDVVKRANTKEDRFHTDLLYYVGGEHIETNELMVQGRGLIKGSTIGPMFYFGFKAGQVLFVTRNPHLRKAAVADFDGICSEKTLVLETKDDKVLLQKYLIAIMQTDDFWDYCEENKSGGVNYFINWSTLADYEFELPSIDEQKVLAEKLWAAYRLKESYKKLLAATDEMVKSRFIEMFKDEIRRPLGELVTTTSGGTPSSKNKLFYENGTIPWLTSGEVGQGYIQSTQNYITDEGMQKSSAKWVPKDSVVVAMYGATVGKTGLLGIRCTTNQAVCSLLPSELFLPKFLYYAVKSMEEWMISQAIGGAQPNISQAVIKKMLVPCPVKELQNRFVAFAEQADKSGFELRKSIESIDAVIKSLINN